MIQWCEDTFDTISSTNQQQDMLEMQITAHQNEMIADAGKAMWEAYEDYNEQQAHHPYQNDAWLTEKTEYITSDPWRTADFVIGGIGLGSSYIGYVAVAAGFSIPVAGQVALGIVGVVAGVYGMVRICY